MSAKLTRIPKRKGWNPDYPDSRDLPFSLVRDPMLAAAVAQPDEDYEIDDKAIPIFDQLNESSCVANAWTAIVTTLQSLEAGDAARPELSRQFLYWTARCLTQSQRTDGGTFLRSGAKALATTGICGEKDWPYSPAKVLTSPPAAAFLEGSNNILKAYYSLSSSGSSRLSDMEIAIKANHPIAFGTQVGMDLENYEGSAADPNFIFNVPATSAGGHALAVMGVRRVKGVRAWKVRNSWGPYWGLAGYFWASDQYMAASVTSDLWAATLMPQFVA